MTTKTDNRNRFWTIPNILTLLRLAMIPIIVWLYAGRHAYLPAALVVGLSGLTDIADGVIARRYNMVTDAGKIIDPIADKLTQLAVIICLATRFAPMRILLCAHIVKELAMGIMGLMALKKKSVNSAKWYGKMSTVAVFSVTVLHLLIPDMPLNISRILVALCLAVMTLALVMYIRFYYELLHNKGEPNEGSNS
ncbi:MAG: CDP-alcohol phosphatidyltransferase family protein [Oscillospiraceae bacterium]|nr:CDP-alcohol phosphatidyltransferase family protein [Oscillospiraceae bacterium]